MYSQGKDETKFSVHKVYISEHKATHFQQNLNCALCSKYLLDFDYVNIS